MSQAVNRNFWSLHNCPLCERRNFVIAIKKYTILCCLCRIFKHGQPQHFMQTHVLLHFYHDIAHNPSIHSTLQPTCSIRFNILWNTHKCTSVQQSWRNLGPYLEIHYPTKDHIFVLFFCLGQSLSFVNSVWFWISRKMKCNKGCSNCHFDRMKSYQIA